MATLFSDFLTALRVKHTTDYSDMQFYAMPFQSLFGLTKLLEDYGITSQALRATDKTAFKSLKPPFLADTPEGFTIVTGISADRVDYISQGRAETAPYDVFVNAWNGVVLLATPSAKSIEPEYGRHHADEIFTGVKKWALWILGIALMAYLFVVNGLYSQWAAWLIVAVDLIGIYVSFMLVQKALNIKNKHADAVCSVLQEGGCDTIAKSEAASFFGIVKWSEVGLAYFSVSLLAILLFPSQLMPWLALCNVCCLPYTVWSITYQKFVAKTWCTMCVIVQISLWLLFFGYLFGGCWHAGVWPLQWPLFALIGAYGVALLGINRFDNALAKILHPNNNLIDNDGNSSDSINR